MIILFDPDDEASAFLAGNYIQGDDEAEELANKTADLMKKSGYDKTLKELEKDD